MEDERLRKERKDVNGEMSPAIFPASGDSKWPFWDVFLWPLFKWLSDFQLLDQKVTAWITLVFIELPTLLFFFPSKTESMIGESSC